MKKLLPGLLAMTLAVSFLPASQPAQAKKKSAKPQLSAGEIMDRCRKQFGPGARVFKIKGGKIYCYVE